jgi:hypothetical protein
MDAAFNDDVVVISGLIFGFSLYFSLLFRNLPRRRVRIRLARQPASPVSRDFTYSVTKKPAVGGHLALGGESLGAQFDIFWCWCAESLRTFSARRPFSGETSRRLGSFTLGGGGGSRDILLHLSVLLRIAADLFERVEMRTISGPITIVALAGYVATLMIASRTK